jgi:serine O-acetyltransferase
VTASQQLRYLHEDLARIVNGRWWRHLSALSSPGFAAVAFYRFDRAAYLALGRSWPAVRVLMSPFIALLRPWLGGCEIHYRADIGPGLLILHPTLGAVVSRHAVVGSRLTLTGGNCLGMREVSEGDSLVIGSDVDLGANATVLGPAMIGSRVRVGAGAVVIGDVPEGSSVVGVPARAAGAEAARG